MIGLDYKRRMYQLLAECDSSSWMDLKSVFDTLYEAAKDFAKEVKSLKSSQTITTVAEQTNYALNPDYLEMLVSNDDGKKQVQFYDSSNYRWIYWEEYKDILYDNNTTSVAYPWRFGVVARALDDRITGTATSSSTNSGGETSLTDTATTFTSTVYPGDAVVNTTNSYIGIAIAVPSAHVVTTVMFNTASNASAYADWTSGDGYMIIPAPRYDIVLDPPPSTSGYSVIVPYVCKPTPVYSSYGQYGFAQGYEEALLKYAVWLHKYKDGKPNYGDALYKYYEMQLRKSKSVHRNATGVTGFRVSFKK